jgi:ABC-type Co2+ transport system permease subunit
VIDVIYLNPKAFLIANTCSMGFVRPFFLCLRFFRLAHGIESLGNKSNTPTASIFAPLVAASIAVLAETIAATLAVCSQCEPKGSHW